MKPKFSAAVLRSSLFFTSAASLPAVAASDSWKTDSDGNWEDAVNWTGANVPGSTVASTSADIATFASPLTVNRAVQVDYERNVGGITFSNTSAFGYDLFGGPLKLSNGGVIQLTGNTGAHTDVIEADIEIQGNGGAATFTSTSTLNNRLLKVGAVSGVSTAPNITTLKLNGTESPTGILENAVSGTLSDGSNGGTLAVVKDDIGAWTLGGFNSYSGGTEVKAGILRITSSYSLGTGDLKLSGGQTHLISNSNVSYANNVIVAGNATITPTRPSGSAGTVVETMGTLAIGSNTLSSAKFSATTSATIAFGVTTLSGNPIFAPAAATVIQLGPVGGSFMLTQNGVGTTVLSDANTFTSATVTAGVLQVGTGGTSGDLGTGGVTLAAAGTLALSRSDGPTFANSITGTGIVKSGLVNNVATLTNDTHTGNTLIQNGVLATNTTTSPIILGTSGQVTIYGVLGLNANFNGSLATTGGNISWAAATNTSGGFAVMDAATRSVNIGGNVTPDTLTIGVTPLFATGTLTGNNSRLKFGDVNGLALGTVDFKNPINLGTGDRSLIVVVDGQAPTSANLAGNISGSGVAAGTGDALVKFGQGNLRLSGTNTYTGRTVVGGLEGAVILGSAGAFSPNTWMSLDGQATGLLGGLLGLGSGNLTANLGQVAGGIHFVSSGGFAAFDGDRSVTLNSGATLVWASTPSFLGASRNLILSQTKSNGKITFTNGIDFNGAVRTVQVNDGSATQDAEIAGPLADSASGGGGGLNKSGAGTLVLSGTNTYAGNTTINGGALILASGGQLGFAIAGTGVNNSVSGTAAATFNGAFNIDLTNPASPVVGNSWTLVDKSTLSATFGATFGITGFSKSGGVHTKADGSNVWTFTEADGKLTYSVSTGGSVYDSWINGYTAQLPNAADRLPGADPDHDGAPNVLEFALKGIPYDGANNGLISVRQADTDGNGKKELTVTLAVRTGATFTGLPSPTATVDGVTYLIQGSSDLSSFIAPVTEAGTALPPAVTGLPDINGSGWSYHTFTLTGSDLLPTKGFIRAKISN